MSRSSRRPGYGPQRGAKNPIITISGTKPVQPKYDDIWIDDTRPWALSVGCMYTSYAEAAVGTTTQTTLFGTGDGTRTIPANWLQQGSAIWARIYGYHTANTETLTLAVKLGDTTVCTVAAAEVAGTQQYFEIDTIVTCYSAGTAGTVRAHGRMLHGEGTATQIFSMVSTASTVIDTSTTLTFDVLAAWSDAAATPSIVSAHANMNIQNGGFLYGVNWWYCQPIYYSDDIIGGENSSPVGGATNGSAPATPPDSYWSSVVLALHFNGSDGSTSIIDNSTYANTVSVNGNAQLDTDKKKFGSASLLLDGNGDYITVPDSSNWDITWTTTNTTIEAWVNFNSLPATNGKMTIVSHYQNSNNYWEFCLRNTSGSLYLSMEQKYSGNFNIAIQTTALSVTTGTWYAVCLQCDQATNNYQIFFDGTRLVNGSDSSTGNFTAPLYIGSLGGVSQYFDGNIDDFRYTFGVLRYSGDYTPLTTEFPDY